MLMRINFEGRNWDFADGELMRLQIGCLRLERERIEKQLGITLLPGGPACEPEAGPLPGYVFD